LLLLLLLLGQRNLLTRRQTVRDDAPSLLVGLTSPFGLTLLQLLLLLVLLLNESDLLLESCRQVIIASRSPGHQRCLELLRVLLLRRRLSLSLASCRLGVSSTCCQPQTPEELLFFFLQGSHLLPTTTVPFLLLSRSVSLDLYVLQSPAHVLVLEVSACLGVRVLLRRIIVEIDPFVVDQVASIAPSGAVSFLSTATVVLLLIEIDIVFFIIIVVILEDVVIILDVVSSPCSSMVMMIVVAFTPASLEDELMSSRQFLTIMRS